MVDGLVVEVLGGDGGLDDLLLDLLAELLGGDVGRVLRRHDNSVDTLGDNSATFLLVLNSDLGLGVGPEPGQGAVATGSSHGGVELMSELKSKGEELRGLVGGVAKHDALVTSAEPLKSLVIVKALSNIGRLLLNSNEKVARLVVETLGGVIVTDIPDGVTDDPLVVNVGASRDLTKDHDTNDGLESINDENEDPAKSSKKKRRRRRKRGGNGGDRDQEFLPLLGS